MVLQHLESIHLALRGQITIGDPLLLNAIELSTDKLRTSRLNKQVFNKTLAWKHDAYVDIYTEGTETLVVINLVNRKLDAPKLTYSPKTKSVSHDCTVKITHKALATETNKYCILTNNGVSEFPMDANGHFGDVWSAKDNVLVALYVSGEKVNTSMIKQWLNVILAPSNP